MGSFRRGLSVAVVPLPAWAEACDKERPFWDGTHVSMSDEVIAQLSDPFTAIAVCVSILLIIQSRRSLILLGVLIICVYALVFVDPMYLDDVKWAAKQEGCIGNGELWWAILAAIFVLGLYRTALTFRKAVI